MIIAVKPTNKPFWLTRSKNGGPSPGGMVEPDAKTAKAKQIGISATVNNIAQVRRRRNNTDSSEYIKEPRRELARNIKALPC